VGALGRGPRLAQLLLYLHHHAFVAIVPSVLIAPPTKSWPSGWRAISE